MYVICHGIILMKALLKRIMHILVQNIYIIYVSVYMYISKLFLFLCFLEVASATSHIFCRHTKSSTTKWINYTWHCSCFYHLPKKANKKKTQQNIFIKQQIQNKIIRHLKNFYIIWYFFNKVIYIMTTVMNIYNKAFMSKIIIKKEAKVKVTRKRKISKTLGKKEQLLWKVIKVEIRLYISWKLLFLLYFPFAVLALFKSGKVIHKIKYFDYFLFTDFNVTNMVIIFKYMNE